MPRKDAKQKTTRPDPLEILENLAPKDALDILRTLAKSDEALAQRIGEMARNLLSEVDPEDVAGTLFFELEALQVEELWDRSGRTRYGYVEPAEAADEMIEEVVTPFLEELAKYQKLGMTPEANRMCMGLLWGFYQFQHEATTQFKEWAPDSWFYFAERVVETWIKGSPKSADVAEVRGFIEEELGGWGAEWLPPRSTGRRAG